MITTPPEETDNPFRTETSSASPSASLVIDSAAQSAPTTSATTDPEPTIGPLEDVADPDPASGLPPPSYKTNDGGLAETGPSAPESGVPSESEPQRKRAPSIEVLPRGIIQVGGYKLDLL